MLCVITGRIAREPELKIVKSEDDERQVISRNSVYVRIDKIGSPEISVPITAWGEQAKELVQYNKGDMIQFVGSVQAECYHHDKKNPEEPLLTIAFTVKKIDRDQSIVHEHDNILWNYIKNGDLMDQPITQKQVDHKSGPADRLRSIDGSNNQKTRKIPIIGRS